uniref:Uncharacterized protein n=1 Tax=Arundo donax TaxID=35708 RepID=A0A0A8Y7P5_ARUDO
MRVETNSHQSLPRGRGSSWLRVGCLMKDGCISTVHSALR